MNAVVMRKVQNFIGSTICIERPAKRTYYILIWDNVQRLWNGYTRVIPIESLTQHYSNTISGTVEVTLHIHQKRGTAMREVKCTANGRYLLWTTAPNQQLTIPILKLMQHYDIPSWCKKMEYTSSPLNEATFALNKDLYTLRPVEEPQQPKPQLPSQPLPRRIATLIAQDAIQKRDDCPIMMTPLELGTCKVTSCYHVFNGSAIDTWLTTNTTCPVCKSNCTVVSAS